MVVQPILSVLFQTYILLIFQLKPDNRVQEGERSGGGNRRMGNQSYNGKYENFVSISKSHKSFCLNLVFYNSNMIMISMFPEYATTASGL